MNRWKVVAGILLIFILGAFCGFIGSGLFFKQRIKRFMDPEGPPPPVRFLQRQLDDFQLSTEQRAQIDALYDNMQGEFVELVTKSQREFKAVFNRYVAQIRKILLPDQQKKLNRVVERIESHLQRMEPPPIKSKDPFFDDRPPGPDPDRLLDRLAWELDLSKDQVQEMHFILEKQWEKRRSLFQEAKDSGGDRKGLRQKMMAIDEETDEQLEAIMTPEQLESFKKLRQKRMP